MGAIQVEAAAGMNGERCIGCSVCVGACPTRAIRLR
jgi:Fe-S-cluster-containing hydrogenase component 2